MSTFLNRISATSGNASSCAHRFARTDLSPLELLGFHAGCVLDYVSTLQVFANAVVGGVAMPSVLVPALHDLAVSTTAAEPHLSAARTARALYDPGARAVRAALRWGSA